MASISGERVDRAIQMLIELGRGNFSVRANVGDEDDFISVVLSGLNMLAEELTFYQEELDRKNKLLQDTLYHISEIVYALRVTREHGYQFTHEFVSPRVESILGYKDEDICNDTSVWFNAIHPDDRGEIDRAIVQLMAGNEVIAEYRIMNLHTNSYLWVEDHMTPKQSTGQTTQIFCSARDISERKAALEEREKIIDALNARYSEVMQFNHIVSHNLRAPVASILGACELMRLPMSEPERLELCDNIADTAMKLDTILKDLNQLLSTKFPFQEKYVLFTLSEILSDIKTLLNPRIEASKAIITTEIEQDADILYSIKSYISSAVYNLLSNALKYTKPAQLPEIRIKAWSTDTHQFIEVSDNGIGIDMNKYGRELFGFYKRFNTQFEGKGLGLHMTRTQLQALDGNITCHSVPGQGSTFTISIPKPVNNLDT